MASVAVNVPGSAEVGQLFTVSGSVRDDIGQPIPGTTVYLEKRLGSGSWQDVARVTCDGLGNYSRSDSCGSVGIWTYRAQAEVVGIPSDTDTISITEPPPPPPVINSVTISAPTSQVEDSSFIITGTVRDQYGSGMGGVSVNLYQNGGHFTTVTTNSSGNYSRSHTIFSPGVYELAANAGTKWAYRDITINEKTVSVGTSITLSLSPSTVEPSGVFTWSGKLSRNDGMSPGVQTIMLLINGIVPDSTACDNNGNFSAVEGAPASDGYYDYRSYFGGATLALEILEASMSPEIRLRGE